MHLLYFDESGTPNDQGAVIVAGILVSDDYRWRLLNSELKRLILEHVPADFRRNGFIAHACDIIKSKQWPDWSLKSRVFFLEKLMELPRLCGCPVSIGICRHDTDLGLDDLIHIYDTPAKMADIRAKTPHSLAVESCISRADYAIGKKLAAFSVGVAICEDIPERRDVVRKGFALGRNRSLLQKTTKYSFPELKINHFVDNVHFASKTEAPLLQLADVCAYGFRRWYLNFSHGDEYIRAITRTTLVKSEWTGPSSGTIFFQ